MRLAHEIAEAIADARADRVLRPGGSASMLTTSLPEPSAAERTEAMSKRDDDIQGQSEFAWKGWLDSIAPVGTRSALVTSPAGLPLALRLPCLALHPSGSI